VRNLCPDEIQNLINVIGVETNDISNIESSNDSSWVENDQLVCIEKLYRRYLVTYYSPLFDIYSYEEPVTIENTVQSLKDNTSEVSLSVEDSYKYEVLPNMLNRLYKKKIEYSFDALFVYSEAIKKARNAFNLFEDVLAFRKEHLVNEKSQLTKTGKSLLKTSFDNMFTLSRYTKRMKDGLKVLNRVNRYRNKHRILKYWYKWKIYNSNILQYLTNELPSEISTVIGDSKRKQINSTDFNNMSRDFVNNSNYLDKENYSVNKSKIHIKKDAKNRKKLLDLSKYFSKDEGQPTPKNNFNAFIKNHDINERDLFMVPASTIKSASNSKPTISNFHTDKQNKNTFENDFDTSNIEIEEIECIINSDDSIFNGIHTEEYNNHTIVMDNFNSNHNHNRTRDIPPKHRGLHNLESVKKNFTYLNNISKVSTITISNSITSSKSSSEKKRLMLNNRRFNKRPPYVKRANKSLAHLTSIPYIMSESNLHSREVTEINIVPK
jgi:hypothetical protein